MTRISVLCVSMPTLPQKLYCCNKSACLLQNLPSLCSSEGAEELQETDRMSVGGQMGGSKSDKEVCVCVYVSVCVCAH